MNEINTYLVDFKNKHRRGLKVKLKSNFHRSKISLFLTKFLISVIFFLGSLIYIKTNEKNVLLYKEYVFSESLPFTKIKQAYEKYFGEAIPSTPKEATVFSGELVYKKIEDYLDGEKLTVNLNSLVKTLNGGIVVFSGEKEGYGNTVIIQGNDGVDIWYGNLANVNVKLYDYLEKDTTIGETKDDILYLVINKDNNYLKYEDYQS